MAYKIDRLFIDNTIRENPLTSRLKRSFSDARFYYGDREALKEQLSGLTLMEGKRSIFITEEKGKAIKDCPGMQDPYICCRLQVLSPISNCPMFCSYCFLQFYLNSKATTVNVNTDKYKREIVDLSSSNPGRFFRLTTGELSDSLALDKETGISEQFIQTAGRCKNVVLELKTKTTQIDHLLSAKHSGNVIFSWSLNADEITKQEEHLSAPIKERIEAARRAIDSGYLVSFHFDPLIWYSSWEEDYRKTVRYLFRMIDGKQIAWISLGTLRFAPGMEEKMQSYFPKSKLPYGEFVKAADGKMRYIKPIRFKLYTNMMKRIKEYGGESVFVYLCMEKPDAWEEVMDTEPKSKEHLDYLFAESMHKRFPERFPQRPMIDYY